jgi:hypothetical protein
MPICAICQVSTGIQQAHDYVARLLIRAELAMVRLGVASLPIEVLLNCDDLVYAALALHR